MWTSEGAGAGADACRPHADVIAGGPPGVGKKLTAEAIAELLHRPLYVVSMGELGTTPEALEALLLGVLDLCMPQLLW